MFEKHPSFYAPKKINQRIWRYIDFTKFVDLLNTSTLFFTQASYFEDIFEGSLPRPSVQKRTDTDGEMIKKGILHPEYTPEFMAKYTKKQKETMGINCWHMNDYESAAMWKLYLKSNEGISIQSTYKKLIDSISEIDISIQIGVVKYIDYEKDYVDYKNGFNPFLHKRKSFEHEKELRAVIWNQSLDNRDKVKFQSGGMKIQILLNKLIENIYVSPDSPRWFTNLVQDVTRKYDLNFKIINSRLRDEPIF